MDFNAILSPFGLAGLVIFSLAVTVIALVRHILKLQDKIDALNIARLADAEARRVDAVNVADKNIEVAKQNTIILQDVSHNLEMLSEKIVIAKSGRSE